MRPLTLAATAVLTVILAYAVFYWTSAGDVKAQLEQEQADRARTEARYDTTPPTEEDLRLPELYPGPRTAERSPAGTPSDNLATIEVDEEMPAEEPEATELQEVSEEERAASTKKEANYQALVETAQAMSSRIQRVMGRGYEFRRGRRTGSAFLDRMGYSVNSFGEHQADHGTFVIDVEGPNLVVVTGTSMEFGNQVEIAIMGPRSEDMRIRRTH